MTDEVMLRALTHAAIVADDGTTELADLCMAAMDASRHDGSCTGQAHTCFACVGLIHMDVARGQLAAIRPLIEAREAAARADERERFARAFDRGVAESGLDSHAAAYEAGFRHLFKDHRELYSRFERMLADRDQAARATEREWCIGAIAGFPNIYSDPTIADAVERLKLGLIGALRALGDAP